MRDEVLLYLKNCDDSKIEKTLTECQAGFRGSGWYYTKYILDLKK